jgi:hypothetical protein
MKGQWREGELKMWHEFLMSLNMWYMYCAVFAV